MNPGLQIALVVLIALALLVPLALGIMGKLKARPGASRPPISETPVNPERQTAEPAATPDVGRSTTPAPEPVTSSTPTPVPAAPLAAIDLGGKLMTFTNLHGKTYENVKLVKADPRAGLIYSFDGGEGSVAFNNLSLEFLDQIGVPTNWPGVMPGRPGGPAAARAPGTFVVGDHVVVRWGGKWEPATIVAFQNFNIVVHITDPASHVANNLYVPTNWVQASH
jgi:hypothetical protein